MRTTLKCFGCAVLAAAGIFATPPGAQDSVSPLPSVDAIFALRKLPEPLVPAGGEPSAADNQLLISALTAFEARQKPDDFSALETFLATNARSPWRLAVGTNLGLLQYRAGLFSRCIPVYLEAWRSGKAATDTRARALADRAAGEYTKMLSRLGRYSELKAFLAEVKGREFVGQATELIQAGIEGVTMMEKRPEVAFRCGPMALSRIMAAQGSPNWASEEIANSQSTMKGMSLTEVAALSAKLSMNYQPAKRGPGAELIMPSVIHWKVGHYAALIRKVGDRYLTQDPTFDNETWHTAGALEAEASGYFLVPPGPLPEGWTAVAEAEAGAVYGKGCCTTSNPNGSGPGDSQSSDCGGGCCSAPPAGGSPGGGPGGGARGGSPGGSGGGPGGGQPRMAMYNFHLMLASLHIMDSPVGHAPPYGYPVEFTVSYAQREASQPSNFNFCNLGPKWNFNWLSYMIDDPANPASVTQATAGGGGIGYSYAGINGGQHTFAPQFDTGKQLSRPLAGPPYTALNSDGSQEIYGQSDGSSVAPRRVFLTQLIDPHGNTTTLAYDAQFRITSITDSIGQQTTFSYELGGDIYKITKVTDPFGRDAQFFYDGSGRLVKIRDVIGIESVFTYSGAGDFINSMTTPYGTTTFTTTGSGTLRRLTATDPAGDTEVLESDNERNNYIFSSETVAPQGLSPFTGFNGNLYFRNSFYWNKKQWKDAPNDYFKCHVYHWLHDQNFSQMSRYLESEKPPLQSRIWYVYPGQTSYLAVGTGTVPTAIGRVVEGNGGNQLMFRALNALSLPTSVTDPVGRTTSYEYAANNIDLLTVKQEPSWARRRAVNAGGPAVGSFTADFNFIGGGTSSTTNTINLSGVTDPAPMAAYQTDRTAVSSYVFPGLAVGASYKVRLHFAEIYFNAAGLRVFNVAINGSQVLTNFDVFVAAGNAMNKAVVREFTASPDANGQMTINFTNGTAGGPKVSAIELINLTAPAVTLPATVASYTYNSQHLPLTFTDAAGQTTTCTYNANGQVTSITNAKSETTTYTYYSADVAGRQRKGRLQQIDGALPGSADVFSFDYDAFGRKESVTSPDGYFLNFTYDALDRPVRVTFPDGTYTENAYAALDRATSRDRLGQVTSFTHNSIRQLVSMTDPANRTTRYSWCKCGDLRQLIDPMGRITTWKHDVAGRITQKSYADGSAINYAYEPLSGKLLTVTDEKGQVKTHSYKLDGSIASISYSNTPVATPSVSFTYDLDFDRPDSVTDGTGTTSYAYHAIAPATLGAGQIASIDGPLANDTATYTYDELGRELSHAVNAVGETRAYDALGRVTTTTNALGAFSRSYVGATGRTSTVTFPNGMNCAYGYHPLNGDFRLQSISQTLPGNVPVGQHTYSHDAHGRITNWTIQDGAEPAVSFTAGYDNAGRLTSFNAAGNSSSYTYDPANNRLSETLNAATHNATHNALNEIVSVNGPAPPPARVHTWDAENRLVAIDYTGSSLRTEFIYDGMSRCVRIVEKNGAATLVDRRFVWSGMHRCEERDAAGSTVVRRFFAEGEQIGGQAYFYACDHLGSVRQVTDASAIRARYDYDAWGRRNKLAGTVDAAFGFTGHLAHETSGLALAPYRAYDPKLGRWLNRDPIAESGGSNLFAYVSNQPLRLRDPLGLAAVSDCDMADWLQLQYNQQMAAKDELGSAIFEYSAGPLGAGSYNQLRPHSDYDEGLGLLSAFLALRESNPLYADMMIAGHGQMVMNAKLWFEEKRRYKNLKKNIEQLGIELQAAKCKCGK